MTMIMKIFIIKQLIIKNIIHIKQLKIGNYNKNLKNNYREKKWNNKTDDLLENDLKIKKYSDILDFELNENIIKIE